MTELLPPDEFEQALEQILTRTREAVRDVLRRDVHPDRLDSVVSQVMDLVARAAGDAGDVQERQRVRRAREKRSRND
jgi:hypothetical protein